MAQVEVVVRFHYEIPDDLEERKKVYGTTDLNACLAIDRQADVEDVYGMAMDEPQVAFSVVAITAVTGIPVTA